MRLLFLASFGRCKKQTVQRRLLPLARAMAARGHVVELLIPPWDCPQEGGRGQRIGDVRVRVLASGPGARGVYPLLGRQILHAATSFAPDSLIVSKGLGYAGWAMRAWLSQGGRAALDVDDLESAQGWGARRHPLMRWSLSRQESRLAQEATGVIAASRFLTTFWRQNSERPPATILHLPNGLLPADAPAPVAENPPHVLLLTRGHDVDRNALSRVWTAILARVPQAQLIIAGGWEAAPHPPRAAHLGWLKKAAYLQTISEAALAIFLPPATPLMRAKSPARLLDCLAQGLPVATLDVGEYGAATSLAGGMVATTEQDLVSWATALLRSPEIRSAQGQVIWRRAQTLSWPRRAAELDAWLHELL